MSERRVVITGMGIVSPVGNTVASFWDSLKNGRSGIKPVTLFDTTLYNTKFGGEVRDCDLPSFFKNPKDSRRSDRYINLAMAATRMAIDDSGIDFENIDRTRFGVMVGSGIGGLETLENNHTQLITKSPAKVSPFTIPMMISNMASGMISMEHNLMGPNMVIVTACATANNNIGEAWRIIKFGDADGIIAGGAEAAILPMGFSGFGNMKALSTRNEEPERASRPFDRGRDGFVMGEGAGVVILEDLEHAKKRGANILCELVGYGTSADAHHLSAPHPDGDGASACMRMALRHAKLNPEEVGYVNAHATSTPMGDLCEIRAIKQTFGSHATEKLLVSSTKSMTGHMLGAAGGAELIACIKALQEGVIPPTINLEDKEPEIDVDCVPNVAREAKLEACLSNSFGFGGHNASVLIRRFHG